MTSEQILQAVRAFAKDVLSLPDAQVRVGPSNGVIASDPYITVEVTTDSAVWRTEERDTYPVADGTATRTPYSMRDVTVRIDGYGPGSYEWLRMLALWWTVGAGAGVALRAAGIAPRTAGDVRHIPQLLDGVAWVQRARLELPCYAVLTATGETVGTADEIALTLDTVPDGITASIDVDLPE